MMNFKKSRQAGLASVIILIIVSALVFGLAYSSIYFENNKVGEQKGVVNETLTVTPTQSPTVIPTRSPSINKDSVRVTTQPSVKPTLPVLSGASIFNAVNVYRSSQGKSQFSVSGELCSIAEKRADYMMADKMAAFKSSGTGSHTGFRDTSYSGNMMGENLAANVTSTANTMSIWKSSPPHNELMLTTERGGFKMTKACIATRVSEVGSIVVLEIGDK